MRFLLWAFVNEDRRFHAALEVSGLAWLVDSILEIHAEKRAGFPPPYDRLTCLELHGLVLLNEFLEQLKAKEYSEASSKPTLKMTPICGRGKRK